MDLEGLGNLGDFIRGIAVVVTLVYLAAQIRQNTRQVQQSVELARAQAIKGAYSIEATLLTIASDAEVARIFRSGLADYRSVSGDERLRFTMLMASLTAGISSNVVEQMALGIYKDPRISDQVVTLSKFLGLPGGCEWWKRNGAEHSPVFQEIINREIIDKLPSPEIATHDGRTQ